MNRRDRHRQKKRKQREHRLAQQRHALHARPEAEFEEDLEPEAGDDEPPATPAGFGLDRWEAERHARRVARAAAGQDGDDALARAAAELSGRALEAIDAAHGDDPREHAQDLAFQALACLEPRQAAALAREALALDPACTDAQVLLARLEPALRLRLERLDEAVRGAEGALAARLAAARGAAWGDVLLRPLLRARHARLRELSAAGRIDQVLVEGRALLELDPSDPLAARGELAGALLEKGELQALRLLVRDRPDTGYALPWARALERFLSGERREAARLVREARASLPIGEDLVLGHGPATHDPGALLLHDLLAADFAPLARAWARHAEARRWLAAGALASTAAERRAAATAYRQPVSALLRLGAPHFGDPGPDLAHWPDYALVYGFTSAHVPDLLRMAEDPALHEQDAEGPLLYAPVHAWRALARLAATGEAAAGAGLAPLLLRRVRHEPDDDWAGEDAVQALAAAGAPALDALLVRLDAAEATVDERSTAACALGALGRRHADQRPRVSEALAALLRRVLEEFEAERREDPATAAEDWADGGDDRVLGFAIAALAALHGRGRPAPPELQDLARRALELADEDTRREEQLLLAALRGESDA